MNTIQSFALLREQTIPELNTHARLFRHLPTGAELLSLENDDENKVFCVAFATPPSDSTGVAHILEHSVLAGSRKYPLKEPFVELIKGSLQSFVNAFTFPDRTCYPVASQNLKDFYNLIDVYLDAVFHPLLTKLTFQQEAWHYELNDPNAPLIFKGVVYNEMKGAYSSPDEVHDEYARQALFPDNTYAVDSGGNPQHIPDLTYEQLKAFHETYYHPSNARFFFYGDDDPLERLRVIDEHLKGASQRNISVEVKLQPRADTPQRLTRFYAAGPDSDGKGIVTLNWLLDEHHDPHTVLGRQVLAHILIGTPASPLRKALFDSGLGEDLAGSGLMDQLRQAYFSIGLKGVADQQATAVEALIIDTLHNLVQSGIDDATIEAAFNTIEFRLRENNTGTFPRGLLLMLKGLPAWLYEGDPLAPLAFEAPLSALKARHAAGERYFEDLIERLFLRNPHRVTLDLRPDPDLGQREAHDETRRLAQARASMTIDDLQKLVDETNQLKRYQETPNPSEVLARLPSLKLTDLDRHNKTIPLEIHRHEGAQLLYHDLFTNGILYLDVGFNLRGLPGELLSYVPLFGRALLELGTTQEHFVQLAQRIARKTGGIWPRPFAATIRGTSEATAWLFLSGKVVASQMDDLLAILRDVLITAQLDNRERLLQIALEEKATQEARLTAAGHSLVNLRLRARFNAADWANEQISGVSYLLFLRRIIQQIETRWPDVLATLEQIRSIIISRSSMLCNITVDEANWQYFEPKLKVFLDELPNTPATPLPWETIRINGGEGFSIPAKVNYVGKAANLYELGYRLHGSVLAITKYLYANWLWERVRMRGGAYSSTSIFDHRSGVFSFLSYRDPNLLDTLEIYDTTYRFLRELELSDTERTRSIIGAISNMDIYQLPDAKGYTSMIRHLVGDTDELRQRLRDELLATSVADFRAFADVLEQFSNHGQVVVLGSQASLESVNQTIPGFFQTTKLL